MRPLPVIACAALAGVLVGCFWNQRPTVAAPVQDTFTSAKQMGLDRLPGQEANLILAGTEVPVELREVKKEGQMVVVLEAHGQIIEEERYVSDGDGFRFAGLSGETFDPPITLARFPMEVGKEWEWAGDACLGPICKPATGKVTSTEETLNLPGGVYRTVRIEVELVVDTGGKEKAARTLRFWVAPEHGIVRREFGFGSTREPRSHKSGS